MANANRLHEAATDLLRRAGFVEQPDGSWKPLIASPEIPLSQDIALPKQAAQVLATTEAGLAQLRYRAVADYAALTAAIRAAMR